MARQSPDMPPPTIPRLKGFPGGDVEAIVRVGTNAVCDGCVCVSRWDMSVVVVVSVA
jgi:hypothetical protein